MHVIPAMITIPAKILIHVATSMWRLHRNETELSHRWRGQALSSLHPSAFQYTGQRLAPAIG
jgi:hypothetical protein